MRGQLKIITNKELRFVLLKLFHLYLRMKFESAFCLTNESRAESIFASKLLTTIFKVYWTFTMYTRHASELVTTKGQEISEWVYEVVALPQIRKILPYNIRADFSNFFIFILGNARSSYIHSEISRPLAKSKTSLSVKPVYNVMPGFFLILLNKFGEDPIKTKNNSYSSIWTVSKL